MPAGGGAVPRGPRVCALPQQHPRGWHLGGQCLGAGAGLHPSQDSLRPGHAHPPASDAGGRRSLGCGRRPPAPVGCLVHAAAPAHSEIALASGVSWCQTEAQMHFGGHFTSRACVCFHGHQESQLGPPFPPTHARGIFPTELPASVAGVPIFQGRPPTERVRG